MNEADDEGGLQNQPQREALIELRFERNMTREEIAEYYNVSIATVRRWIKELGVPRPARQKKPIRLQNITPSGEIIADVAEGYTRFEIARIRLEGRVIERTGYGYYLDGRPASVAAILSAAGA